jgi:hypothetical protein
MRAVSAKLASFRRERRPGEAKGILMSTAVSSGMAVAGMVWLIALGLVLLFLWAIYKRGGIDHLISAAKAIGGLLKRKH